MASGNVAIAILFKPRAPDLPEGVHRLFNGIARGNYSSMNRSLKISLIGVALLLLVCVAALVLLIMRPVESDEPDPSIAATTVDRSQGPMFEVHVVRPRMARALFGILPTVLEKKLSGETDPWFDQRSAGARLVSVEPNHLELSADGWQFVIERGAEGGITPATYLVYPTFLAERQQKLRCRPANPAVGYLHTTPREGSEELDGRFMVELATCENSLTGKVINWPPRPLSIRGSFWSLPQGRR
jgi:hypothetical protein